MNRALNATPDEVRLLLRRPTGQLWRPMKPQPVFDKDGGCWYRRETAALPALHYADESHFRNGVVHTCKLCPGDVLYVRETWAPVNFDGQQWQKGIGIIYKATPTPSPFSGRIIEPRLWRSSVTMPRERSRIDIEVVAVQAKQVQEVTETDAQAVGCKSKLAGCRTDSRNGARYVFHERWNSLYAKRGLGWDKNPWAWVFEYRRMKP